MIKNNLTFKQLIRAVFCDEEIIELAYSTARPVGLLMSRQRQTVDQIFLKYKIEIVEYATKLANKKGAPSISDWLCHEGFGRHLDDDYMRKMCFIEFAFHGILIELAEELSPPNLTTKSACRLKNANKPVSSHRIVERDFATQQEILSLKELENKS